jgi:putative flavoprotein involved in K+ transport
LHDLVVQESRMTDPRPSETCQVVVIGGGQAGLSVGYCLAQLGLSFVILEAEPRIGDSWRNRWDSLHLFTPAKYDGLIGLPFPAPSFTFPSKDEMGDYLEAYAKHFDLPVRTGTRVTRVSKDGARYVVDTGDRLFHTDHVVVAMATFQAPQVPEFASALDPGIVQLHSRDYRNTKQLRPGGVLIVGAGNSGAEIAVEVARSSHPTLLSGRHPGHVPFRVDSGIARLVLPILFRIVFHRILTVDTPMGRRARPRIISRGGPLIRVKPADLDAAGVERSPRVTGVRDGKPLLADGRVLDVANVIWCTGFHPGFSWIDLPSLVNGEHGEPVHEGGVVPGEPGLYFVGLHFLYAFSSTMIHGVARDAERIAGVIGKRVAAGSNGTQGTPAGVADRAAMSAGRQGV